MKYGYRIRQRDNGKVVSESGCKYDSEGEAYLEGGIMLLRAHPTIPLDEREARWAIEVFNPMEVTA